MRWGLALVLVCVAAIVIATRCRSDQSTHGREQARTPAAHTTTQVAIKGTASIEGTVVSARGPIDARVCLDGEEPICVPAPAGVFRLEDVRAGRHVLFAMANEHAPS